MRTVSKVTLDVRLLIIIAAVALVGLILTVAFFIAFEISIAFVMLFITLGICALLLQSGSNTARLDTMRRDLRRLEKTLNDTAGSAGKSAPLIRDIHGNLGLLNGNDAGIYVPNIEPHSGVVPDELQNLTNALEERNQLESQALRQIVAEARLIRMYVEKAENNDAQK